MAARAWLHIVTLAVLAGGGSAAGAATEPAGRAAVVTNPDWLDKPTGEELENLYPEAAAYIGLEGRVVLRCSVAISGLLTGCSVLEETPGNAGFGKASIAATAYFKLRPKLVDGVPVEGQMVEIPLVWKTGAEIEGAEVLDPLRVIEKRYPELWSAALVRLKAAPVLDSQSLALEMQQLSRDVTDAHLGDILYAPPSSLRKVYRARLGVLETLRPTPVVCARFAGNAPSPTSTNPEVRKAYERLLVSMTQAMADGGAMRTPHGRMTPADISMMRDGLPDDAAEVWGAVRENRTGLINSAKLCDGMIAFYAAFVELPDDVIGRYWRSEWGDPVDRKAPTPSAPDVEPGRPAG